MNPDGIKRAVRTNRHDRLAGDAPSLGRVARIPGTGLPKGEYRRGHKAKGGRGNRAREGRKRVITVWTAVLSVAAIVLLGVGVWLGINKMRSEREVASFGESEEKYTRVASKFQSLPEAEALALVERALAVREPARVAKLIRPGQATPEEVVEFMKGLTAGDGEFDGCEWLAGIDANGLSIDGVQVRFKGGEAPRYRLAMLTPDAGGTWRMDFDAFARTVTPSWTEILGGKAATAVVRIYVGGDSYFNGAFADEKEWVCYGLGSPDTREILLGYCKRGSAQARALRRIVSETNPLGRATLELKRVDGAERRQFLISKVLAEDWVLGEQPFDARF